MYELYSSLLAENPAYTYAVYTALDRGAVGIMSGLAAVDSSSMDKLAREQSFPLKLLDKGIDFMCVNGEASFAADRERILAEIGQKTFMLDNAVHGVVAVSAIDKVLKKNYRCADYLEAAY